MQMQEALRMCDYYALAKNRGYLKMVPAPFDVNTTVCRQWESMKPAWSGVRITQARDQLHQRSPILLE